MSRIRPGAMLSAAPVETVGAVGLGLASAAAVGLSLLGLAAALRYARPPPPEHPVAGPPADQDGWLGAWAESWAESWAEGWAKRWVGDWAPD